MKIGYIVHNINDPAVERRCRMLERGGATVLLAGFCRDAELSAAMRQRKPLLLGQSHDAAMMQRALATLKATIVNDQLAEFMKECAVIMARNLEQLAIAKRLKGARRLVYECLDIHRSLTGSGPSAKAIQFVEARLLPSVDLLLTSSPAFLKHHFDHTTLSAPSLLLENKVLVKRDEAIRARQPDANTPIVIGWFGMLRCKRTFAFLSELTAQSDGRIQVLVCGKPSQAELPDFEREAVERPGMMYTGPYTYDELPELYGRCHFAWAIDWFEEGQNSSWLLPNRIYEAAAFGAVPIALSHVEVGRWLEQRNIGLRVVNADDARARLLSMDPDDVLGFQKAMMQIPPSDLIADSCDCVKLVEAIMGRS